MKLLSLILFFAVSVQANQAEVFVKLSPTGDFKAAVDKIEGKATLVDQQIEAKAIRIPLNLLKSGIALRDDHMKNKYLQVDKFPYATLTQARGQNGQGEGMLEIRGIKKPVTGTYQVKGQNVLAEFDVKLSDYDIQGIRYMGVGVKDQVKIKVKMRLADAN